MGPRWARWLGGWLWEMPAAKAATAKLSSMVKLMVPLNQRAKVCLRRSNRTSSTSPCSFRKNFLDWGNLMKLS